MNFFRVSGDVELYSQAVKEAGAASKIEADFLKYSTNAMEFLQSRNPETAERIKPISEQLAANLAAAHDVIHEPSHLEKLEEIEAAYAKYDQDFREIAALLREQEKLIEDMIGGRGTGARLIADIEKIMSTTGSLSYSADPIATAARDEAMRAQLFSSRTFGLRSDEYGEQTIETLGILEQHLEELETVVTDSEAQAALAESLELLAVFQGEFDQALDAQGTIDDLINTEMRELQDIIIADTEWLEHEAAKEEQRLEEDAKSIIIQSEILVVALAVGGLLLGAVAGLTIGNNVSRPIIGMNSAMTRLARSDWSVDVPGGNRGDEIGEMSKAVQTFKENGQEAERLRAEQAENEQRAAEEKRLLMNQLADDFDRSVGGVVETVAGAATELEASSQTVASSAEDTSHKATTVSAAAEEASANVQSVASATEELTASIREIAGQVARSTEASSAAVNEVDQASEKVRSLSQAAKKIGDVISMITEIAEQTNLLALNATIESARAGEAGKGFAVVASEVKTLANQTARATEEIAVQIQGIQNATEESVSAIESIGTSINKLNEVNTTIASAIEEQSAATNEIGRNVEDAATGARDVSTNIIQVNEAANESGRIAGEMQAATTELSSQSVVLKTEVDKFLAEIRS